MELPDNLITALAKAERVCALTGAGISAESGVPTFRGAGGLWNNYRAEDIATPEAFERDPALVWRWYDWRRGLVAKSAPNPGHYTLARFAKIFKRFTLITQNVDGLHSLAGSFDVLELHGNIWRTRCLKEGTTRENREVPLSRIPPVCPGCGSMLRPHIVWFGESLDPDILQSAYDAAGSAEVFFVVGTSGVVQPAASLASVAKQAGAVVVEVNVERTSVSHYADFTLLGPSGEVLPMIEGRLAREKGG